MVRASAVALGSLTMGAVAWLFSGGLLGPSWAEPVSLMVAGLSMAAGSLLLAPRAAEKPVSAPALEQQVEPQRATA